MTEHPSAANKDVASVAMPTSPPQPAPDAVNERLRALQPARKTRKSKPAGPAPSRIIAAAASVSAGIGLVALMAGAQQDVVVQVNPTPITVQPASIVVEMPPAALAGDSTGEVQVRVVEPAVPVERSGPQARVATQSEGS